MTIDGVARACTMAGALQLGQLGVRPRDPHPTRTEGDNHGDVILDLQDPAKAVAIVGHLILHVEPLNRRTRGHVIERAGGQEAPGRAADRFHYYQYAPLPSRPGRFGEDQDLASVTAEPHECGCPVLESVMTRAFTTARSAEIKNGAAGTL